MSIQALAWAIEQPVPGEAKLVLMSLANHADHTTGHCSFDPPTIAIEASVTEAAIPRYVGALRRNGYLAREEKGREREYWIQFDREPREWAWSAAEAPEAVDAAPAPVATSTPSAAPTSFRPAKQAEARKAVVAAVEEAKPQRVFVIEGSKAWDAWIAHRRANGVRPLLPPTGSSLVNGRSVRGWWFESLFPRSGGNALQDSA